MLHLPSVDASLYIGAARFLAMGNDESDRVNLAYLRYHLPKV